MNRLQTKCLVGSALSHVLLFGVLVIAPAFLAPRSVEQDPPPIEWIPDKLIDDPFQGGGGNPGIKEPVKPAATPPPAVINPPAKSAAPEPAAPPQPAPARQVTKPPPEPEPAKPDKDPTDIPQKVVPKQAKQAKPDKADQSEKPDKPTRPAKKPVQVNLALAKRSTANANADADKAAQAKAEALAQAKADADRARIAGERREAWNSTLRGLNSSLSSTGMAVEMPGPGGESYANYRQFVKSIYNWAWVAPEDISDDASTVVVRVIIARDGTVKRSEITTRSGIPALDKSVQGALNRVRAIGHPFPEGAKEDEREFRINFNLKSKRSAG